MKKGLEEERMVIHNLALSASTEETCHLPSRGYTSPKMAKKRHPIISSGGERKIFEIPTNDNHTTFFNISDSRPSLLRQDSDKDKDQIH